MSRHPHAGKYLVNEQAPGLVVLVQHLGPQVHVGAFNDVASLRGVGGEGEGEEGRGGEGGAEGEEGSRGGG